MVNEILHGIFLFISEWVVTALLPDLFKKSIVFYFSTDSLQNLTIFHPAMWNAVKCSLVIDTGYT
jgi:hypothetical protein